MYSKSVSVHIQGQKEVPLESRTVRSAIADHDCKTRLHQRSPAASGTNGVRVPTICQVSSEILDDLARCRALRDVALQLNDIWQRSHRLKIDSYDDGLRS